MDKRLSELEKAVKKYTGLAMEEAKRAQKEVARMTAGALASISERKREAPTKIDRMEKRLLKILEGWTIMEMEVLFDCRILPEAKRRAKLPK